MKKILFIIPSLSIGGTNRVLEDLIANIEKEYEISVYSIVENRSVSYYFDKYLIENKSLLMDLLYKNYTSIISRGIGVVDRYTNNIIKKLVFSRASRKFNDKYDVIIGFEEAKATLFASKIKAKRKIAWIHCDYARYYDLIKNKTELKIYNKFDNVVCVAKAPMDNFVKIYPSMKDKSLVIYNPLNCERILELSKEKVQDVIFDDRFKICSIGRFDIVKQFHLIPEIASKIKDKDKSFVWYIIGGYDNNYGKLVQEDIKKYNLEENVILLGAKSNPYKYLSRCDIYVSTSYSEAYPTVINEAKCLSKFIIANEFPSLGEILDDKCGIVSKIESLDTDIVEFIGNEQHRGINIDMNEQHRCINIDINEQNDKINKQIRKLLG